MKLGFYFFISSMFYILFEPGLAQLTFNNTFKYKNICSYSYIFWTLETICNEQQYITKTYCYVTLRLSWCTAIFPGFLTTAVTMWPCCSAWLTRCCPVCPVAPSTVIFIFRLQHRWLNQAQQTLTSRTWTARKFPPCSDI